MTTTDTLSYGECFGQEHNLEIDHVNEKTG